MTEPQSWTLIVGFLGILVAFTTMALRTVRADVAALRADLHGEVGTLRAEIAGRFDALEVKVENIDRDVQWLMNKAAS